MSPVIDAIRDRIAMPLGMQVAILVAVISGTWYTANILRDTNERIAALEHAAPSAWTQVDQSNWTYQLQSLNPSISVPIVALPIKKQEETKQ